MKIIISAIFGTAGFLLCYLKLQIVPATMERGNDMEVFLLINQSWMEKGVVVIAQNARQVSGLQIWKQGWHLIFSHTAEFMEFIFFSLFKSIKSCATPRIAKFTAPNLDSKAEGSRDWDLAQPLTISGQFTRSGIYMCTFHLFFCFWAFSF